MRFPAVVSGVLLAAFGLVPNAASQSPAPTAPTSLWPCDAVGALTGCGQPGAPRIQLALFGDGRSASPPRPAALFDPAAIPSSETGLIVDLLRVGGTAGYMPRRFAGSVAPVSSQQYLDFLRAQSAGLSNAGREMLLVQLGNALRRGYDYLNRNATTDQIFQNWRRAGSEGGVCADIHEWLTQAALALGYGAGTGTHTTRWGGSHVLMQLEDPQSREWAVLNFSQLILTHRTDPADALDVSQRTWSSFNPTFEIVSDTAPPRLVHTQAGIWADALVREAAYRERSSLSVSGSNRSAVASARYAFSVGHILSVGPFLAAETYQTHDGNARMTALGASLIVGSQIPWRRETGRSPYVAFRASAGRSTTNIPHPPALPATEDSGWSTFYGGDGLARVPLGTDKAPVVEITGHVTDFSDNYPAGTYWTGRPLPWHWIAATARVPLGSPSRTIEAGRAFQAAPANWRGERYPLRPLFDRISVALAPTGTGMSGPVAAWSTRTDLYFFNVAPRPEAVFLRERFSVHAVRIMSVVTAIEFDVSGPLKRSDNMLWRSGVAAGLRTDWQAPLGRKLLAHVTLSAATHAEPLFYLLESPTALWSASPVYGEQGGVRIVAGVEARW